MNITVVTPYDSSNFGAFLQAYCLKEYLSDLGHQVTHIPTRPADYVESLYFSRRPVSRKEKLFPPVHKKHLAFGERKYSLFSRAQETFRIVNDLSQTDLVVLGSDEIWNVEKPVFHNSVFWGDLSVPSISYAASIGDASPEDYRFYPDQTEQLEKLRYALVRDENTEKFVEQYTALKPELVCDPTILWPADRYGEECTDEFVRDNDCLLVYAYTVSKNEKAQILRYARARKLKVVTCCFYHGWSDHQVECSPLAFSSLIRQCRLVYTSSFHGTVFAMLNHANFVCSTDNPKTRYLLRQYGLEDRFLEKNQMDAEGLAGLYASRPKYRMTDKKVLEWRKVSGERLQKAIALAVPPVSPQAGTAAGSLICFHNSCSGCFACRAVCREGAISIGLDSQGRTVPEIDPEKCVGCGACRKICPQRSISMEPFLHDPMECIAARGRQEEDIEGSSSGGISALLSSAFIRDGNAVCGAVVSGGKVEHRVIRDEAQLPLLRGSKYVQSNVAEIYEEIRRELGGGQKVLFLGTPCQADAMNRLFGRNSHFYAVDIICHGVPPMEYLRQHLGEVTKGADFDSFRFRGSTEDYTLKIFDGEHEIYSKHQVEDTYFYAFMNGVSCRENCYNCRYSQSRRAGDLTIGDFWGIDHKTLRNSYSGNISVIFINTEKGRELFEMIKDELVFEQREVEEAVSGNPQLHRPALRHSGRGRFLRTYMESGSFSEAVSASGIEKAMKRMQFGRTGPGKAYVFIKKFWQGR